MPACGACGAQAPDAARFCPACGARLAPAAAPESRRRVTVLFSDLVIERHGGIVEKFIGDAVTAVFGVPARREDDALRAIRAALDMRASQERLNDELQERFGVRLRVRTGVNTGEVVAGDPGLGQAFVVGDAVNVAARLEQAAPEGEILVGAETERLVRDDVVLEPVPAACRRSGSPTASGRRGARRRSRWSAASGSWRPCTRRSRAAPSAGAASW
jgi:class 3 adenylate cyclase